MICSFVLCNLLNSCGFIYPFFDWVGVSVQLSLVDDQERNAGGEDGKGYDGHYDLCPPATLHNGHPPTILVHGRDIVAKTREQAGYGKQPEDQPQGLRDASLEGRRGRAQMEGYRDCYCYYGHVDAQFQGGEECSLIGTVIPRIAGFVVE